MNDIKLYSLKSVSHKLYKKIVKFIIMRRRTHLALGILSAGLITIFLITFGLKPELGLGDLMLVGGLFGILPDSDVIFRKHRNGLSHSIFTSFLILLVILSLSIIKNEEIISSFFTWDSALVASVAVLSHTLADSLTSSGVPLYYPFGKRKHVHFPLIGGRLSYDNSFANKAIEIGSISLLIFAFTGGLFIELDFAPENFVKLIHEIIKNF
ncbi:MAG: inner membrane protein [Candidatus Methanofastidiosum methylothiophilum]|uniref:Inner membrane protein n=1 Tax=Candidatus Methanofastidiosum methylothiophilum TaxID=1705564 RepID=A0A150IRS9_9EURY|nr:MAG: inner membrane protein [Candidatus Methanofastidiosum methylthiophilus]KYC47741.1 MAG: inner membrane protein [Candidatus Methanofastidiosum methylthiophilus]KYC50512.1 MAG: inner membrane protein [Candidatus Methanofastidiosum methylthiophilus]